MKIQLDGLSFAYGQRTILDRITTSIATGTFSCLLGPNGAGKTTLFRILTGHLAATQGRVTFMDGSGSILLQREIARRFAILPQGVQDPPHLTVREVVALGRFRPEKSLGWRLEASDRAAIGASLDRCGVDHLADRPFTELSGGEKQRAWLAFCLAQEKEFLLLDESLGALDFLSKRAFFQLLAGLSAEDRGILLATHDLDMASQFATRLMILQRGGLAYDGPPRPDLSRFFVVEKGANTPRLQRDTS